MYRSALKFLIISLLAMLGCAGQWTIVQAAADQSRLALVIGNESYSRYTLKNPVNDADDMSAKLRLLGFDVFDGYNLNNSQMNELISRFNNRAKKGADVVLFYFAGHGFQMNGTNYIVPTDAMFDNAERFRSQVFEIQKVISGLESPNRTTLVFLDACRDNPFEAVKPASGTQASRSTSLSSSDSGNLGLAKMATAQGTFIAFSTQPGNVALDGAGRNSPFTGALLKHIGQSGRSISDLMIDVRNDVQSLTSGKQTPWDQSSLTSQFYFKMAALDPAEAGQTAVQQPMSLEDILANKKLLDELRERFANTPGSASPQDSRNTGSAVPEESEKAKPDKNNKIQATKPGTSEGGKKPAKVKVANKKKRPAQSDLPPDVSAGVGVGGL